jgi:hydroxymethylpyrimidine pyrophosphatase-like HAD family hydrolase
MKKDIIAIDLHGTLLDEHWRFPENLLTEFKRLYAVLKDRFDFYLCTGNDISFLNRYLSSDLLDCFTAFILETGAVFANSKEEKVLIKEDILGKKNELEVILKQQGFEFIKYFAQRKASISLFTITEDSGENPELYYPLIKRYVENSEYNEQFYVTYSNVAIDIIPRGISKYTGLKQICHEQRIISLLDSMNDFDLAVNSDICFLPGNSTETLLKSVEFKGIEFFNHIDKIYLCRKNYGEAVIEALSVLVNR